MFHSTIHRNPLLTLARLVGLGSAVTTILLYCIFLFMNPYSREGITGGTYVVGAAMILLALLAAWGARTVKPSLLLLAFVGSFIPVGLYFLGTPGIFAFIGVANLLYLCAAILMFVSRSGTKK